MKTPKSEVRGSQFESRDAKSRVRMAKSGRIPRTWRWLTVVVLFAAVQLAAAQTMPVMLYGGPKDERATALVEGVRSGFCLAGWTRSLGPGTPAFSNVLVTRTNSQGAPVWSRISTGTNDDEAYSMVRTTDHGYALTGWTRSFGPGLPHSNIFVIKLDSSGNQVWGWVYGGPYDDEAYSIVQTANGGYAVCGRTWSWGPAPAPNPFVLRLDPAGNPVWLRAYWDAMTPAEDEGYSIVEVPPYGFAVCGRTKEAGATQFDPFLMLIDTFGFARWRQVAPGAVADDEAYSVALDNYGRILVSGWTRTYGTAPGVYADVFVAAFSHDGALLWSRTYGWPMHDEQVLDDRSLVATADGGSAVCGLTKSVGPGVPNANCLLLKLDPMGIPMWCRSHPSPYWPGLLDDVALPLIEQTGGGYASAGYSNSFPLLGGGDDFMFSTFDAMGNRPVCAEPQCPELDSMPWTRRYPWDTLACPYRDTMRLVPVQVMCDSVCYEDTLPQGIEEPGKPAPGRLSLRVTEGMVELNLVAATRAVVSLYSADGRRVVVLATGELGAGRHELALPAGMSAGTYIVRADARLGSAAVKFARY